MQSIAYSILNFEFVAKSSKGTHGCEDFEVLFVVTHDVRHETETS
jgi:hypothetical protein